MATMVGGGARAARRLARPVGAHARRTLSVVPNDDCTPVDPAKIDFKALG